MLLQREIDHLGDLVDAGALVARITAAQVQQVGLVAEANGDVE